MMAVSAEAKYIGSTNKLLEVNNLNVVYYAASGTVHALTDVNITLERGQILGIAGESGSGKSTLAYAITRLLRPPAAITEGQILYYPQARHEQDLTKRVKKDASGNRIATTDSVDIL